MKMYDINYCKIHDKIEYEKHYTARYGAPGMPRKEKRNKTPEEMAKQNHWRKCRDLRRLIELNFEPGDWHVTLTCRKEARPSKEEAVKLIRHFRDKLRGAYKKQGWDLKYIITCEIGERGAVHWHMIVNAMHNDCTSTAKLIRELWEWGRSYFVPLDDNRDYKQLAEYIVKETTKRIEQEQTIEKLSYMASRNLKRPIVRTKKSRAKKWSNPPRVPKGYELVSLYNGINKFTGLPYQHYTIRRREGSGKDDS